jgi:alkylhydroperoxidase family enzyme
LFQVAAWHDAVYLTPKERAALALTDAVTKLGDAAAGLRLRFGLSHRPESGVAGMNR